MALNHYKRWTIKDWLNLEKYWKKYGDISSVADKLERTENSIRYATVKHIVNNVKKRGKNMNDYIEYLRVDDTDIITRVREELGEYSDLDSDSSISDSDSSISVSDLDSDSDSSSNSDSEHDFKPQPFIKGWNVDDMEALKKCWKTGCCIHYIAHRCGKSAEDTAKVTAQLLKYESKKTGKTIKDIAKEFNIKPRDDNDYYDYDWIYWQAEN